MSTHKRFDIICCVVFAFALILTVLFMNAERFGVQKASTVMGYEKTLFDTSKVHTIDIIMDDWDEFSANCKSEEYYVCTVVIDNEAFENVAIRGKGNTSLSQVTNDRYSYKIEFDHYDSTNTYYGLDKLCLNNIIQDNTYMKDYLTYQMMKEIGVASPLCSYVNITVNGEDWGLYLAVEGVEESFLQRNYGKDYGELYKPDSVGLGGGRGNGEKFDIDKFLTDSDLESSDNANNTQNDNSNNNFFPQIPDGTTNGDTGNGNQIPGGQMPNGSQDGMPDGSMPGGQMPNGSQGGMPDGSMPGGQMPNGNQGGFGGGPMPDGMTPPDGFELPDGMENPDGTQGNIPGGIGSGMTNGSDDVLLKYIDDDADSYSNIFDNAKTDITNADKNRLINALKKLSNGEDLENTVDIDAVIRYFVVHNFVLNFDSYTGSMIHNYYLYEKDGQMQMIPWDYNLAFGGFQSEEDATTLINYPIDSPVSGGNAADRPMIAWIFANEEYTELYHQYFEKFIEEYFDSGYFSEMIDSVHSMISPYVEKDPTKFCTYEEFETGIATLKEFCLLRAESINGQLNGTIGSTASAQESSTLINADEMRISAMGSMEVGGGMQPGGDMQPPQGNSDGNGMHIFPPNDSSENPTDPVEETPSDDSSISENGSMDDNVITQMPGNNPNGQIPNNSQGGTPQDLGSFENNGQQGGFVGQMPDGNGQMQPQEENTTSSASWIMIGVSLFVLALGLVFAFKFNRRK